MNVSFKKGLGFGLTSGIITTLGLIVGLNSGTGSRSIVIGGILIIAIADSMSDAFGIHISEEVLNKKRKEIWQSTISTFLFKFVFALSFVIPILFLKLDWAMIVSIIWGFFLLTGFSFYIAKKNKDKPFKVIAEHLMIATIVIILTHFIGVWISNVFV
jgi:VIT1/CCC1 family predicted Fe2+/Mn2+ transporter